jgi:phosphoserine/homoserine phosphotransferase
MYLICSDLEGVFVPEVWINVAEKTGIPELRATTREIPDFDLLMNQRIKILYEHGLKLTDIQSVVRDMVPIPGAINFIEWIKGKTQLIVVSDNFAQVVDPLMIQLGKPTLFCHDLVVDSANRITNYKMRQPDLKNKTVEALQGLKYNVIAIGDSYNDISMLKAAEIGILFRPPQNVIDDFPELRVTFDYDELKEILAHYI